jgi:hypothetical protein
MQKKKRRTVSEEKEINHDEEKAYLYIHTSLVAAAGSLLPTATSSENLRLAFLTWFPDDLILKARPLKVFINSPLCNILMQY